MINTFENHAINFGRTCRNCLSTNFDENICIDCGCVGNYDLVSARGTTASFNKNYSRTNYVWQKLCELEDVKASVYDLEDLGKAWGKRDKILIQKYKLKSRGWKHIPKYCGHHYRRSGRHHSLIVQANKVHSLYWNGSNLNLYYTLLQIVRLEGGDILSIPYNLKNVTTKKLNTKWHLICDKLGWKYVPVTLDELWYKKPVTLDDAYESDYSSSSRTTEPDTQASRYRLTTIKTTIKRWVKLDTLRC